MSGIIIIGGSGNKELFKTIYMMELIYFAYKC